VEVEKGWGGLDAANFGLFFSGGHGKSILSCGWDKLSDFTSPIARCIFRPAITFVPKHPLIQPPPDRVAKEEARGRYPPRVTA
jgi:hypothetical protein